MPWVPPSLKSRNRRRTVPPAPKRKRSMAVSRSSDSNIAVSRSFDSNMASPATLAGDPAHNYVRPSAEEWYPRLHLGWNHKECVDVYCYFTSRPSNADFEIKWAIKPLGPPFHGKRPMSFDHILQLTDTQSNSDSVKRAIVVGLSTQYYGQEHYFWDTPAYKHVEPTWEEILMAWEDHSLNISVNENVEKVKDAVMSTFGFYITTDEVELLKRFSTLNKVSIFETSTWRQMLCFKCCPRKEDKCSPEAPISKENLRKRKNDECPEDNAEPASKRPALPASEEVASNTELRLTATANASQASTAHEHIEEPPAAASSTDLASTTSTNGSQASTAPGHIEEAPTAASSTDLVATTSTDTIHAPNPSGDIDAAQRISPPTPENTANTALSTTLTISSWLRLLHTFTLHSGKTSTTIQKWLKDTFDVDATLDDIAKITESAKAENISPLQTTAFKCMVVTVRKDLGAILMNPRTSTGLDMTKRAPLRGVLGNIEAAVRKASGRVQTEGVMVNSEPTSISNCA